MKRRAVAAVPPGSCPSHPRGGARALPLPPHPSQAIKKSPCHPSLLLQGGRKSPWGWVGWLVAAVRRQRHRSVILSLRHRGTRAPAAVPQDPKCQLASGPSRAASTGSRRRNFLRNNRGKKRKRWVWGGLGPDLHHRGPRRGGTHPAAAAGSGPGSPAGRGEQRTQSWLKLVPVRLKCSPGAASKQGIASSLQCPRPGRSSTTRAEKPKPKHRRAFPGLQHPDALQNSPRAATPWHDGALQLPPARPGGRRGFRCEGAPSNSQPGLGKGRFTHRFKAGKARALRAGHARPHPRG